MNQRIAAGLALLAAALLLGFPAAAGWLGAFDVPLFRLFALTQELSVAALMGDFRTLEWRV